MCPERFPESYVRIEETKPGSAGQLQQRPSPRGGGMFKHEWIKLVDVTPRHVVATVRYYDCAASTAKSADNTAGVRLALDEEGIVWVENVICGKWSPGERDKVILATTQMDGKEVYVYMEQEPGASGLSLIAHYTRLLGGYVFRPDRVDKKKELRAEPVASYMEAGNVRILNTT